MTTTSHFSVWVVLIAFLSYSLRVLGWDQPRNEVLEAEFLSIVGDFNKAGRQALPRLAQYVSSAPLLSRYCDLGLIYAYRLDGWNMLSEGDPELIAATRTILSSLLNQDGRYGTAAPSAGLWYLAQKGNLSALPLMEQYLSDPYFKTNQDDRIYVVEMPYRVLQTRIAGTNIVVGLFDQKLYPSFFPGALDGYSTNYLGFLPSVANTGPQAEYVYKAYWQAIGLKGGISSRDTPYSVITNVAPELLTMRVWFNAKGNAVTDTDLSKYGISVPGLGLASIDSITNAPPAEPPQEPTPVPPAQAKPYAVPLIVGVGLLAGLLIAVRLWKRR